MSRNAGKRERDRKARYARTFGLEAAAVRLGPCVAMRNFDGPDKRIRCRVRQAVIDDELQLVWDPAHVQSVGADGTRMDLVRLCSAHHGQQHDIGIESFGEMYGLDLRALADEQALAHPRPLGILGLADRWSWWQVHGHLGSVVELEALDGYLERLVGNDLAALLSWVRRRMAAYVKGCADIDRAWSSADENDRDDMVTEWMSLDLEIDTDALYALCALAGGWPS